MPTIRAKILAGAAAVLGCCLAGCSSEPVAVTVNLTGNDAMKFDQTRFEFDAPAKVTIHFKNIGTMSKVAMGHNFVLLKKGVKPIAFAGRCLSEGAKPENEQLPESVRDDVIVFTKVLGPGEEATVVADIPEAGTYAYVCTFPGHAAVMRGEFVAR